MRRVYTLAWIVGLPFALIYLLWRSRRQPEYRQHWGERLGFAPRMATPEAPGPVFWLHAVSVGETHAAAPVLRALLDRHPQARILLTHGTPTGRAAGAHLFGAEIAQGRLAQAYLPYDLPWLARAFVRRARPALGLILETELWPNLLAVCQAAGVPVALINARLSERSARGYARFSGLARQALAALCGIAAQSEADAARLSALGATRVTVTGNLKFDVTLADDLAARAARLRQVFPGRFVLLCASTREGEETLLLDALAALPIPNLLLLIVPRHPQRFDDVARLIETRGLAYARRSDLAASSINDDTRVLLGDSMGEMPVYYSAADLAYIGGSLLPLGGQNLIEAAACGCPALIGPHTWNFAEAAEQAVAAGAARRVADAAALTHAVLELAQAPETRAAMAAAGRAFAAANRGASARTLAFIETCRAAESTGRL